MYNNLFRSDILFSGYYGQLNTGDDAFVEVSSWGAVKYWNKRNNIFLANKDNLPVTVHDVKGYPFSIPRSSRIQNRLLLRSSAYFISAGGSTIHRAIKPGTAKYLAVKMKGKDSRLKIGGIGVSVGPFNTAEDEISTISYLKEIDFLAVRDQASYDFVSSLDLPYKPVNAFDLAALLPKIYGISEKTVYKKNKKIIGISVCPYESIVSGSNLQIEIKRNNNLVELLKYLDKQENIHFKFIVFNGHPKVGDLNLTRETVNQVSPSSYEIVHYTKNTRVMWDAVSSCDFVITTRLHAAVFACFSNTPFMLNEYHKKCGDFLNNIGYKEEYRLHNNDYSLIEKGETIIGVLNNIGSYENPIRKLDMESLAELNFTGVGI